MRGTALTELRSVALRKLKFSRDSNESCSKNKCGEKTPDGYGTERIFDSRGRQELKVLEVWAR